MPNSRSHKLYAYINGLDGFVISWYRYNQFHKDSINARFEWWHCVWYELQRKKEK